MPPRAGAPTLASSGVGARRPRAFGRCMRRPVGVLERPESLMSELHKFLFEGLPVRGMLVRLTESWREVLSRRRPGGDEFAPPVRALLGEMAAAAILMQGNLQFQGALILQAYGDGPVKLAVAEVQSDLAYRVTAKVVGD